VSGIERLLAIMARLRDPQGGCPWDLEQSFETIAPCAIEEAYEVDDAVRRGDFEHLRDELGDLLLQVVFHAQMAREKGIFDFGDVAEAICDKLVRRHPHVFGEAEIASAAAQTEAWERQKASERASQGATSFADGVPLSLPALARARKLAGRAARAGLARPSAQDLLGELGDALAGLRLALASGERPRQAQALGALLLAAARLAAGADLDAEASLRDATAAFEATLRDRERPGEGR
jgi:nucleoside triphosphate diphosphatase